MRASGFFPPRTGLHSLAVILLALIGVGCSKNEGNVSGKVLYQGKPLPGGYVNFMSGGEKSVSKTSAIKEDGSYSVSGLPVGTAKISIQGLTARRLADLPGQGGKDAKVEQKEVYVPPQYGNTETSGLKYEVKVGAQSFDIELK
jgi:hypothetical protein